MYFYNAFIFTALGLLISGCVGWLFGHSFSAVMDSFFICFFLAILEISLSFDNAIVNARILGTMSPLWRKRFFGWGLWIAVFGMRIIFPLLIVCITLSCSPYKALSMALFYPRLYMETIKSAHVPLNAFGGTFLLLVALSYFFDKNKEIDWLVFPENWARRIAHFYKIEYFFVLGFLLCFSYFFLIYIILEFNF